MTSMARRNYDAIRLRRSDIAPQHEVTFRDPVGNQIHRGSGVWFAYGDGIMRRGTVIKLPSNNRAPGSITVRGTYAGRDRDIVLKLRQGNRYCIGLSEYAVDWVIERVACTGTFTRLD